MRNFLSSSMLGIAGVLSRTWLAWSLVELGDDEAILLGKAARREAEAADHALSLATAYQALGCVYALRDDVGPAVGVLERGMACAWGESSAASGAPRWGLRSATRISSPRYDDGTTSMEAAVREAETHGIVAGHAIRLAWLAEALLASNRPEEAEEVARRAIALAGERGEPGHETWALRALAEVLATRAGRQAEAPYHRALALADPLGMAPLTAHCRLGLGRALRRAGALTEACGVLGAASMEFAALGMSRLARLASRELEASH